MQPCWALCFKKHNLYYSKLLSSSVPSFQESIWLFWNHRIHRRISCNYCTEQALTQVNRAPCTCAGAPGRLHWLRWGWLHTAATAWHTRAGTPRRPHAGQWCPQVPGPLERPALGDAADIRWNPGQRWCAVAWSALVHTSETTVLVKKNRVVRLFEDSDNISILQLVWSFISFSIRRSWTGRDSLRYFSLVCVNGIQWTGKICFFLVHFLLKFNVSFYLFAFLFKWFFFFKQIQTIFGCFSLFRTQCDCNVILKVQ